MFEPKIHGMTGLVASILNAPQQGQRRIVAIAGPPGSGKSTILKTIAGLISPKDGTITLHGETKLTAKVEDRPALNLRQIQMIFQNPDDSLNPRHTVAQILAQPLRLYFGLNGDALRHRSAELVERVRLGAHYLDRLPSQLSGGEKQRVAIARAFAAEPCECRDQQVQVQHR